MDVNTLKNILVMGEKEKVMLQEELDNEREFKNKYEHNVEIQRKNMVEAKQKNKILIKKLQDDNEELKGSTSLLKSQYEELYNLKEKVKIWETIERKQIEALFLHKKQHEALDSQVKALNKKKEGEGECFDKFGIEKFEKCVSIGI